MFSFETQPATIRIVRDVVTKAGLAFTAGMVVNADYSPRSNISAIPAHYTAVALNGYRTSFPANYAERV